MNKFQKIAYKMAKLERDSGRIDITNSLRFSFNCVYGTSFEMLTFEDIQKEWYKKLKKRSLEEAYDIFNQHKRNIEYVRRLKEK